MNIKKILSPYIKLVNDTWWTRHALGNKSSTYAFYGGFSVYLTISNKYFISGAPYNGAQFLTKEEAMQALDKWLLSKGYIFLPKEEFDKLEALV